MTSGRSCEDRPVRHTYTCQVRWGDMDLLGHVNNVIYADYLQEARADLLKLHGRGPTDHLLEGTLVVDQQLQHVAPLRFDGEPVQVDVWVARIRAASFTLAYEVYREDADGERTVYLRARTGLAPYLFDQERPRRLSDEERKGLEVYLEPTEIRSASIGEPRHLDIAHYPVHVRFSDVDIYGHANNVKYLDYFQEARILWLHREMSLLRPTSRSSLVVAQQDVEYKRPMVFRSEPYDAWTWASRIGTTSMTLEAEIRDRSEGGPDGVLMARGRYVVVFVDPETGRAIPPTDEVRAVLDRLVS
jgi:acyl-CoA thioester hydrolase